MSESQSFVETTLPPGYRGELYGQGWEWHTRAEGRAVFATRAECCRSAWRHWTAAVLRGRGVRWGMVPGHYREAYDGRCASIIVTYGLSKHVESDKIANEWVVYDGGYRLGMPTRDIDEAMARFAAIVLATEGMVPR